MGTPPLPCGTVWRTRALTIERTYIPAGTRLRFHGHDSPHLCFLEAGGFEERHAGRDEAMVPGMLRGSPSGDEHDIVFRPLSCCFLILLHGDQVAPLSGALAERQFVASPHIERLARGVSHGLTAGLIVSPLRLEAAVLELVAATLASGRRRGNEPPMWLTRIREQIHDEPSETPSTAALAAACGYHPVYVARAFRQFYGIGLSEYGRLVRAEFACELLATQDEPLSQIALRAGYADQSHLTRSLRHLTGFTPAEVRRRRRPGFQVASLQDPGGVEP